MNPWKNKGDWVIELWGKIKESNRSIIGNTGGKRQKSKRNIKVINEQFPKLLKGNKLETQATLKSQSRKTKQTNEQERSVKQLKT